jgi:hypothetical protein
MTWHWDYFHGRAGQAPELGGGELLVMRVGTIADPVPETGLLHGET